MSTSPCELIIGTLIVACVAFVIGWLFGSERRDAR